MLDWMDKGVIAFKIDSSSIVIHCANHTDGIHFFINVSITLQTGEAHDDAHSFKFNWVPHRFCSDDFDVSFDSDDTGQAKGEAELNYVDLFSAKIVLDTSRNQFKLVWFDTDPPRHTDIQRKISLDFSSYHLMMGTFQN